MIDATEILSEFIKNSPQLGVLLFALWLVMRWSSRQLEVTTSQAQATAQATVVKDAGWQSLLELQKDILKSVTEERDKKLDEECREREEMEVRLTEQLEDFRQQLEERNTEVANLRREVEGLRKDLAQRDLTIKDLTTKLEAESKLIGALQIELETVRKDREEVKADRERVAKQNEALKVQVASLEKRVLGIEQTGESKPQKPEGKKKKQREETE